MLGFVQNLVQVDVRVEHTDLRLVLALLVEVRLQFLQSLGEVVEGLLQRHVIALLLILQLDVEVFQLESQQFDFVQDLSLQSGIVVVLVGLDVCVKILEHLVYFALFVVEINHYN